ncbi:MAG: acyl-CoA dehydrogenase family protein [Thermodesulfobacteriota bacterium]|nr:acyl-CoA dehydrogenase family protein [Thermodesulfobacteriota bacterium]
MDFDLTSEQLSIQKAAREFAEGEFDIDLVQELEMKREFPWEIWKKSCKLGFVGMDFPEEYGGQGYGLFEAILVHEEFCRKAATFGMVVSGVPFGSRIILKNGTEEQKQKYLIPMTKGEMISAGAFTEPDRGSDLTSLSTIARKEGKDYIINGTKTFTTMAGNANFIIVLCQTDPEAKPGYKGQSSIIVETDRKGIEISKFETMGWRTLGTTEVSFTDVRVPEENLIGRENRGFYQSLDFLNEYRALVGAIATGIAQGAFDRALKYAKEREAFGRKIGEFQAIQHKLAEMATKIETARLLTYKAAHDLDKGVVDPKLCSMTKWFTARVAAEVADEAIEILGGHGYMTENEVERFYRDARALELVEGTREIQKNTIARILLGKLR